MGGLRVRAAGGNSNNGATAGASYSNANYSATSANSTYSSPLYFALNFWRKRDVDLAPWQKMTRQNGC